VGGAGAGQQGGGQVVQAGRRGAGQGARADREGEDGYSDVRALFLCYSLVPNE